MVEHELKVWPAFFARLIDGTKTFEVRKDDRGFQMGDLLVLQEYDPAGDHDRCRDEHCRTRRYTGRELRRRVGFIFKAGFGVDLRQHVVLSLLPEDET